MVESNTWEGIENLQNTRGAVEEFEKEYQQDMEDIRWQERKKETFRREELPEQFTAKKLFRWSDKQYNEKYWGRLERNWKQQKGEQAKGRRTLEMIQEEEEEIKQKESEIREQTEEDEDKIGNIVNPDYEL